MKIGLPKEIKDNEYRVGLTPAGVNALSNAGHEVYVQKSAGEGSGFSDELYVKAGGKAAFSEYYMTDNDNAIFRSSLRKNVVFSRHNLVTDRSFNEFNVILCRNVLIYFNSSLQSRVHSLLYESLGRFGVLGLGHKETISCTPHEKQYEVLEGGEKLYRRVA